MKKVRKGSEIEVVSTGASINKEVYRFLLDLEVDDSATIDNEDWHGKTKLSHTIHNVPSLKGKFRCRRLLDKSGWLIERIK